MKGQRKKEQTRAWKEEEKQHILKIIHSSTTDESGCKIWNGPVDGKGKARAHFANRVVAVLSFVWNSGHSDEIYDSSKHKFIRTCGNKKCVNGEHLLLKKRQADQAGAWEKLIQSSERNEESGCLIWKGWVSEKGYGKVTISGKTWRVHRYAFVVHHPEVILQEKEVIRHKCENKLCFEPSHLEKGTQFENIYDDQLAAGKLIRGEAHASAKITEETAKAIKWSKSDPNESTETYKSQAQRAKLFNVSIWTVKSIDRGKSWAHLPQKDGTTRNEALRLLAARKQAEKREANKLKTWTPEMFAAARTKLLTKTKESVEIREPFVKTKCLIWKGKIKGGDFFLTIHGKTIRGHILACEINAGRHRREGEIARHLCGVSLCCEPEHLKFGTPHENSIDTLRHGTHPTAKLTEKDVREIRTIYAQGKTTQADIGKKYNVTDDTIRKIVNKQTWKHVE